MDIDILIDPSSSYSVIKSFLLRNIRSKFRTTEDGYGDDGVHACYRVVVSAHGSDTIIVKSTKKNSAVNADVVITFQQMKHALPSYECDQGSVSELSNSDFQNKVLSMESTPFSALNDTEVTDVLMEMLKSTKFE